MKILHTSDWHLGHVLFGRRRYEAFEAFLLWLAETIHQQQVDVLLIAGDVFDTSIPSNRAQQLYYRFLGSVAASSCRHVVVVAGNHDSPSFLNAPRELLKALNVHVLGHCSENLDDEVLLLQDAAGQPALIVCAVPYLRDRDIRRVEPGETVEDKGRKLLEGISQHYADVAARAEALRQATGLPLPIIATGHLFVAGGQLGDSQAMRDLYVGSLGQVSAAVFPTTFDYVALGHLHIPQTVAGLAHIRYCGSPLPMGFAEARQQKTVCLAEFSGRSLQVTSLKVPCFQRLEQLRGDWPALTACLQAYPADVAIWLEVLYEGEDLLSDLRRRVEQLIEGTALEVLCVRNSRITARVLERTHEQEALADLRVSEVFERCLVAHAVTAQQRPELLLAFEQTLRSLQQNDPRAD